MTHRITPDKNNNNNHSQQQPWDYGHKSSSPFFHPLFRIIECGRTEGTYYSTMEKNITSMSINDCKCEKPFQPLSSSSSNMYHKTHNNKVPWLDVAQGSLHLPATTIKSHRPRVTTTTRIANQALLSSLARKRHDHGIHNSKENTSIIIPKRLRFHNPLVSFIVYIPKIQKEDIHHLFFSDVELEQLYKERHV